MIAPTMDPAIARNLAALDRREQLAATLAGHHLAAGPAVEPDPTYQPRHLRRTTNA